MDDVKREKAARVQSFALEGRTNERRKSGVCLHPMPDGSSCDGKVTAAHTVQRAGGLKAISDEAGKVLTVVPNLAEMIRTQGNPKPRLITTKEASTFPGFCNKHDGIFADIETTEFSIDDRLAFLFAYRSICSEAFRKDVENEFVEDAIKTIVFDSPLAEQAGRKLMNAHKFGAAHGQKELQQFRSRFDKALLKEDWDFIDWMTVEFDGMLPLVASTSFIPEYDFAGAKLQELLDFKTPVEPVTYNLVVHEGKSIAVFAWPKASGGAPTKFVDSFLADVPDDQKANAIICSTFEACENLFIHPDWWEGRTDFQKEMLLQRTKSGTPAKGRSAGAFRDYGRAYSLARPVRIKRK